MAAVIYNSSLFRGDVKLGPWIPTVPKDPTLAPHVKTLVKTHKAISARALVSCNTASENGQRKARRGEGRTKTGTWKHNQMRPFKPSFKTVVKLLYCSKRKL